MNLLRETIETLEYHNLTPNDVRWVGSHTLKTTWDDFARAADVEYDSGFGAAEVATDLLVVGDDWWLSRLEYDGSEWWNFNTKPTEPTETIQLKTVTGGMWDSLRFMNENIDS